MPLSATALVEVCVTCPQAAVHAITDIRVMTALKVSNAFIFQQCIDETDTPLGLIIVACGFDLPI